MRPGTPQAGLNDDPYNDDGKRIPEPSFNLDKEPSRCDHSAA
jgi:hypothetical protein